MRLAKGDLVEVDLPVLIHDYRACKKKVDRSVPVVALKLTVRHGSIDPSSSIQSVGVARGVPRIEDIRCVARTSEGGLCRPLRNVL